MFFFFGDRMVLFSIPTTWVCSNCPSILWYIPTSWACSNCISLFQLHEFVPTACIYLSRPRGFPVLLEEFFCLFFNFMGLFFFWTVKDYNKNSINSWFFKSSMDRFWFVAFQDHVSSGLFQPTAWIYFEMCKTWRTWNRLSAKISNNDETNHTHSSR